MFMIFGLRGLNDQSLHDSIMGLNDQSLHDSIMGLGGQSVNRKLSLTINHYSIHSLGV